MKTDRLAVHEDDHIVQHTHSIDEDNGEFETAVNGLDVNMTDIDINLEDLGIELFL